MQLSVCLSDAPRLNIGASARADRVSLMGKSDRDANKASKLERDARRLSELNGIIAQLWGIRAECVEAAALFVATAERLRIVRPGTRDTRSAMALDVTSLPRRCLISFSVRGADCRHRQPWWE